MLWINLGLATGLVIITFLVHLAGLICLSRIMHRRGIHPVRVASLVGQGASILAMVAALFALHSLEIWLYAFVYLALSQFPDLETALYFSTNAFTTVGFGDVTLGPQWRLLGAAESINGFLLIGWSTAFLVSVTARVRVFEADLDRLDRDRDKQN